MIPGGKEKIKGRIADDDDMDEVDGASFDMNSSSAMDDVSSSMGGTPLRSAGNLLMQNSEIVSDYGTVDRSKEPQVFMQGLDMSAQGMSQPIFGNNGVEDRIIQPEVGAGSSLDEISLNKGGS